MEERKGEWQCSPGAGNTEGKLELWSMAAVHANVWHKPLRKWASLVLKCAEQLVLHQISSISSWYLHYKGGLLCCDDLQLIFRWLDWTCALGNVLLSQIWWKYLSDCELVPEWASCGACLNTSRLSFHLQCLLKMISKQVCKINVFAGITEKTCSWDQLPLLFQWLLSACIFVPGRVHNAATVLV